MSAPTQTGLGGFRHVKRSFIALAAAALLVGACSTPASTPAASIAPSTAASTIASPSSGPITITDAMGRKVTFASLPKRVAIAGKALFMVADAVYLFPEASSRVVALGNTVQNKLSFPSVVDPAYATKTILDGSAGAEQIAATQPDVVLMKSSNADTLGKPLDTLGVKIVYVDFETPDHSMRLRSVHPGVTVEEIRAATGFELVIPDDVPTSREPTDSEIRLIRDVIDPAGLREREVPNP